MKLHKFPRSLLLLSLGINVVLIKKNGESEVFKSYNQ